MANLNSDNLKIGKIIFNNDSDGNLSINNSENNNIPNINIKAYSKEINLSNSGNQQFNEVNVEEKNLSEIVDSFFSLIRKSRLKEINAGNKFFIDL